MPKNQVNDPITDQEIAFARLVLSGTVTDRGAAEATGLNPDTAAYTKSKPRVRAYMVERRAAINEQLAQQETEGLRRQSIGREQVLKRLWEIANLSHEATRNSASAQIKALSLITAIEGLIPDRRATVPEKKPKFPPATAEPYKAPWLLEREAKAAGTWVGPDIVRDEDEPSAPPNAAEPNAPADPVSTPNPEIDPARYTTLRPLGHPDTRPSTHPAFMSAADNSKAISYGMRKNRYGRRQ